MAYVIQTKTERQILPYLPETGKLKTGRQVIFDQYRETDVEAIYEIFQKIVEEGQTYPQETVGSLDEFRKYYLAHEAFVVRDAETGEILGAFYVKPNYPGRSSHICNGGFITKENCRGQGLATFMVPKFLRVAPDLGFKASVFNLVYVTNGPSIKLWENFGFKEIGRVPNAGNLKGLGYTDAIIYYYEFANHTNNQNGVN